VLTSERNAKQTPLAIALEKMRVQIANLPSRTAKGRGGDCANAAAHGEGEVMKAPLITNDQFDTIVGFLDEHPRFAPMLDGPEALVVGFQVGACCLTLREMVRLASAEPILDAAAGGLCLLPSPTRTTG